MASQLFPLLSPEHRRTIELIDLKKIENRLTEIPKIRENIYNLQAKIRRQRVRLKSKSDFLQKIGVDLENLILFNRNNLPANQKPTDQKGKFFHFLLFCILFSNLL